MDKEDKEERERNCKDVQILHNKMILYNGDMVVRDFMCSHTFLVRNVQMVVFITKSIHYPYEIFPRRINFQCNR